LEIRTEIYDETAVHHSLPLAAQASSCDQKMSFAYAIPVPINFPDDGTSVFHQDNVITTNSQTVQILL